MAFLTSPHVESYVDPSSMRCWACHWWVFHPRGVMRLWWERKVSLEVLARREMNYDKCRTIETIGSFVGRLSVSLGPEGRRLDIISGAVTSCYDWRHSTDVATLGLRTAMEQGTDRVCQIFFGATLIVCEAQAERKMRKYFAAFLTKAFVRHTVRTRSMLCHAQPAVQFKEHWTAGRYIPNAPAGLWGRKGCNLSGGERPPWF
ncbi:uncharacterized protein BT62DRAFT_771504 [Guyanagaster necrorhizus]|uniref:Uncharacterized protein n=1 Tax=Guyanagaster necrorhizus TaxID=856835 RepID=A0A9P8AL04_9AGAR|nr:uncharacterized protein BT62DRAFT_771504 [Guyanagaster necrorhizus MCA 3950]KAG7439250.1 hypothetical protein BT62DRAFT_771504 [Guyanagaster necrorhizus MCA 3950]